MRCTSRHRTRRGPRPRPGRWAVGLALLFVVPATATAAAASSPDASTEFPTLTDARSEVARSEARLVEATATRDAARLSLSELDRRSAELATQLADARATLRSTAVSAFVTDSGETGTLLLLHGDALADAASQQQYLREATERSHRDVTHYDALKAQVDPQIVRIAERLQRLDQDVADASDAVLAARATEAEAERQESLRQAAQRAAEQAARRAEAARRAATSTTAATTTTANATATADSAVVAPAVAPTTTAAAPAPAAPTTVAPTPAPAGGPSEAQWAALRKCESGGNYAAVSASGKYRGAYQFDYRTWATLGSPGDPAAASPAEQDARARRLYAQRGWRPWPVCGRYLR